MHLGYVCSPSTLARVQIDVIVIEPNSDRVGCEFKAVDI